jgi:hypothetical protein
MSRRPTLVVSSEILRQDRGPRGVRSHWRNRGRDLCYKFGTHIPTVPHAHDKAKAIAVCRIVDATRMETRGLLRSRGEAAGVYLDDHAYK